MKGVNRWGTRSLDYCTCRVRASVVAVGVEALKFGI